MNIDQLISKIRAAQNEVNAQLGQQLVKQANDTAVLIKNRVLRKQLKPNGSSWGGYSQKKIPAFFYFNEAIRLRKGMNEIRKMAKNNEKLSYAGFRKLIGKTNKNKNFELTGQMWLDFGVTAYTRDSARLGFKTPRSERIAQYNSNREGMSIIEPSPKEKEITAKNLEKWVTQIFIKNIR